jgi:hypothetical protein
MKKRNCVWILFYRFLSEDAPQWQIFSAYKTRADALDAVAKAKYTDKEIDSGDYDYRIRKYVAEEGKP